MAIDPNTELRHPELGPIRFHDGRPPEQFTGVGASEPMWICRPEGWDSEFEIHLPNDAHSPTKIDQAIAVFRLRDQIETAGRRISGADVSLGRIDFTVDPPGVAFPDNDHVYAIWNGWLDSQWQVRDLQKGSW